MQALKCMWYWLSKEVWWKLTSKICIYAYHFLTCSYSQWYKMKDLSMSSHAFWTWVFTCKRKPKWATVKICLMLTLDTALLTWNLRKAEKISNLAQKYFFDQTLWLLFFALLILWLLFEGGDCCKTSGINDGWIRHVQSIQWRLLDPVSTMLSFSVLLLVMETSRTTRTALAIARWSSSEIISLSMCVCAV